MIEIEIYLKKKSRYITNKFGEIHYPDWKIKTNDKYDIVRFFNKLTNIIVNSSEGYVITIRINNDSGDYETYCYNSREFRYYVLGFEKAVYLALGEK